MTSRCATTAATRSPAGRAVLLTCRVRVLCRLLGSKTGIVEVTTSSPATLLVSAMTLKRDLASFRLLGVKPSWAGWRTLPRAAAGAGACARGLRFVADSGAGAGDGGTLEAAGGAECSLGGGRSLGGGMKRDEELPSGSGPHDGDRAEANERAEPAGAAPPATDEEESGSAACSRTISVPAVMSRRAKEGSRRRRLDVSPRAEALPEGGMDFEGEDGTVDSSSSVSALARAETIRTRSEIKWASPARPSEAERPPEASLVLKEEPPARFEPSPRCEALAEGSVRRRRKSSSGTRPRRRWNEVLLSMELEASRAGDGADTSPGVVDVLGPSRDGSRRMGD